MTANLLEVKQLTIGFNTSQGKMLAVNNINFNITPNEVVALIGESGSGKTMTALAVPYLLPPAAQLANTSQIIFKGQDLLNLSEVDFQKIRGRQIGLVFQEPMTALNPVLTIGNQIGEVLKKHFKLSKKAVYARVLELLHEVGIKDPPYCYGQYPHQLSGGMRQRVVIAIAIACHPDLLIADEPTSALDVSTEAQILKLLHDLQIKFGMSMLFITHDLNVAKKISSRILVLKDGNVIDQGTTEQILQQKKYTVDFSAIDKAPPIAADKKILAKPLLDIKELCVYFPIQKGLFKRTVGFVKAVDDVNLRLYQGKTIAVVGESGSGKTTLAKAILKLLPIYHGQIFFEDVNLPKSPPLQLHKLRRDIQIIFQDPFSSLNPRMLVVDIIAEGLWAQELIKTDQEKEQRVDELLEQVGLSKDFKYRYPHEFSGGQRQRIGIARALAVKPQLIVCDEPTSALDVESQLEIITLLQKLQNKFKLSYVFITHNIPLAAAIADDIAVMQQGKIVEQGATHAILKNPKHPYTKKLVAIEL